MAGDEIGEAEKLVKCNASPTSTSPPPRSIPSNGSPSTPPLSTADTSSTPPPSKSEPSNSLPSNPPTSDPDTSTGGHASPTPPTLHEELQTATDLLEDQEQDEVNNFKLLTEVRKEYRSLGVDLRVKEPNEGALVGADKQAVVDRRGELQKLRDVYEKEAARIAKHKQKLRERKQRLLNQIRARDREETSSSANTRRVRADPPTKGLQRARSASPTREKAETTVEHPKNDNEEQETQGVETAAEHPQDDKEEQVGEEVDSTKKPEVMPKVMPKEKPFVDCFLRRPRPAEKLNGHFDDPHALNVVETLDEYPTVVCFQNEWRELRCPQCNGNCVESSGESWIDGLDGFRKHLNNAHGLNIPVKQIPIRCLSRVFTFVEVGKLMRGEEGAPYIRQDYCI
ncbi:hypothetical protein BU16DRAFT_622990 [Lophium mytilinum]|uniref:Uncharacterized protein n=1 Tax=Lophium mytilinum TaxID=390894 RepID=A0A6A6QBN4_9PEZI|nr:hypothetical protein BU16DRAFT_622990 [Lophium mytilinum]